MPYSQQVLAVLVSDRQHAVANDRAFAQRAGLRRACAAFVYALAKGVIVLAVVIDDEPVYAAGKRAR